MLSLQQSGHDIIGPSKPSGSRLRAELEEKANIAESGCVLGGAAHLTALGLPPTHIRAPATRAPISSHYEV